MGKYPVETGSKKWNSTWTLVGPEWEEEIFLYRI